MQLMHNNIHFTARPNPKDESRAKLEINYEDAASACMVEHLYLMKSFYDEIIKRLEHTGAPPIAIGMVNQVANETKLLDFIKEVS